MKNIVILIGVTLFLMHAAPASPMQSPNYTINYSVFSSGGGFRSSGSYHLTDTISQSASIGISQSASYKIQNGFWSQLLMLVNGGDLNGDGTIDLQDAILALQILSSAPLTQIYKEADINGDGTIGIPEAIYILQKVGEIR
jgi:hypothetical protein